MSSSFDDSSIVTLYSKLNKVCRKSADMHSRVY